MIESDFILSNPAGVTCNPDVPSECWVLSNTHSRANVILFPDSVQESHQAESVQAAAPTNRAV